MDHLDITVQNLASIDCSSSLPVQNAYTSIQFFSFSLFFLSFQWKVGSCGCNRYMVMTFLPFCPAEWKVIGFDAVIYLFIYPVTSCCMLLVDNHLSPPPSSIAACFQVFFFANRSYNMETNYRNQFCVRVLFCVPSCVLKYSFFCECLFVCLFLPSPSLPLPNRGCPSLSELWLVRVRFAHVM